MNTDIVETRARLTRLEKMANERALDKSLGESKALEIAQNILNQSSN